MRSTAYRASVVLFVASLGLVALFHSRLQQLPGPGELGVYRSSADSQRSFVQQFIREHPGGMDGFVHHYVGLVAVGPLIAFTVAVTVWVAVHVVRERLWDHREFVPVAITCGVVSASVVAAGPASVMVAPRHRSVPAALEWSCWNDISWTDPATNVRWWVADWGHLRGEVHSAHGVGHEEFSAEGRVTILSAHKAVFTADGGVRFHMVVDTGMHDDICISGPPMSVWIKG